MVGAAASCTPYGLTCPKASPIFRRPTAIYLQGRSGQIHSVLGIAAVSFIEVLRTTKAEGLGQSHQPLAAAAEEQTPWIEQLKKAKSEALAESNDPWRLRLERVRGKTSYDRVERISTQDLFDFLDVPQRARTAGACRRLATLMRELGWIPVKARGMTQSGFRDQVRGYARDTQASARDNS